MRLIITIILLVGLFSSANARIFYVAANGNDANSGLTTGLPWRTLLKVNTTTFVAGDSVVFRRGDTFYGSLVARSNGTYFGAYGIGVKPVITGFTTITGWQSSGNGIYSVIAPVKVLSFNLLTIDGLARYKARSPNVTAANGGYLSNNASDTFRIIRNVAGLAKLHAEVVYKPIDYIIDRGIITRVVNDTCWNKREFGLTNGVATLRTPSANNFGHFFQNDSSYLDVFGEWQLDSATKRLRIYFGANNPASYTVKIATVDTLFNTNAKNNIVIDGLAFIGGGLYGVYTTGSTGTTVKNSFINLIGAQGISGNVSPSLTITNDTIKNCLSGAIYMRGLNNTANGNFIGNVIDSIGMMDGMGSFCQRGDYRGIYSIIFNNLNIIKNKITKCGGAAIMWGGSNVNILQNKLDSNLLNNGDDGSMYTYDPSGGGYTKRVISQNFISNTIGSTAGTASTTVFASGIYTDGTTDSITISGNVIWKAPRKLITCNSPTNITIRDNILFGDTASRYNVTVAVGFNQINTSNLIRQFYVKNNQFYQFKTTQVPILFSTGSFTGSLSTYIAATGFQDSNYYNYTASPVWQTTTPASTKYTLASWKTLTAFEPHARTLTNYSFDSTLLLTNWSNADSVFTLVGSWKDITNATYSGTITLAAYTGKILFKTASLTPPVVVTLTPTPANCNGTSTGSITSSVSGGTGSYTYLWSNGATTANITNVPAATYSVTVTSGTSSTPASATVTQPTAITVFASYGTINYAGNTTSVTITASGGTQPYVSGTGTFTGQGLGSHTYVVTDSHGCTGSITINIPLTVLPLTVSLAATDEVCNGGTTADVTSTVAGGVPPYTYAWSPGGATTANLINVAANTYNLIVTDAASTTSNASATINQPTAISVGATYGLITSGGGTTTVVVSASGGTPPYSGTGSFPGQDTGLHTFIVTDANGCTGQVTVDIPLTPPATITVGLTKTDVTCNGGSNGSITITPSGGTPPYSYLWNDGATTQNRSGLTANDYSVTVTGTASSGTNATTILQPTAIVVFADYGVINYAGNTTTVTITASGGTPAYSGTGTFTAGIGLHTYVVSDVNGCTGSITINIPLTPLPLSISLSKTDLICNGVSTGNITSTVSGGIPPYVYQWSNGATTANISGIAANTYTLVVTAGSTDSASVTVNQPTAIQVYASYGEINYAGNTTTVVVTASGGTPAYSGTGSFTAGVGLHTYIVTDANGCTGSISINIPLTPLPLSISIANTDEICFGGSTANITTTVTGGIPPYTYLWNDGATTQNRTNVQAGSYSVIVTAGTKDTAGVIILQPTPVTVSATSGVIYNLAGSTVVTVTATGGTAPYTGTGNYVVGVGTYTYTVTDANGCTGTTTIKVPLSQVPVPPSRVLITIPYQFVPL